MNLDVNIDTNQAIRNLSAITGLARSEAFLKKKSEVKIHFNFPFSFQLQQYESDIYEGKERLIKCYSFSYINSNFP